MLLQLALRLAPPSFEVQELKAAAGRGGPSAKFVYVRRSNA